MDEYIFIDLLVTYPGFPLTWKTWKSQGEKLCSGNFVFFLKVREKSGNIRQKCQLLLVFAVILLNYHNIQQYQNGHM